MLYQGKFHQMYQFHHILRQNQRLVKTYFDRPDFQAL